MIFSVIFNLFFLILSVKSDTTESNECAVKEFQDVAQRNYSQSGSCNQETGAGWKGKLEFYFKDYKTLTIRLRSDTNRSPFLVQRADCVTKITVFVNEKEKKSNHIGLSNLNAVTIYLDDDNCSQNPKPLVLKVRIKSYPHKNVKELCFEASKIINVPKCDPRERQAISITSTTKLPTTTTVSTTTTTPIMSRKTTRKTVSTSAKEVDQRIDTNFPGLSTISAENPNNNLPLIPAANTSSSQVPLIAGAACGGLLLTIGVIALGVWLYKKRKSAAEAEEMEMNTDINDVYGTYGECGEGDYNIVEDNNPYYEAGD